MKIGFLYGGQGSQQENMGKDLYENYDYIKKFYDGLNLNFDIRDYSFNKDLDTISETKYTQPIMVAFQIAVTKILKDMGIKPDYVAGLSLGEYSALVASGVLNDVEAVKIAEYRGNAMTEASSSFETGMIAVMGMELSKIEEVLNSINEEENRVEIANLNCPGQIVISGEASKILEATERLKEAGARRIRPLNVSGPFHTTYMKDVSEKLESYFKEYDFKEENIPVVYNLLGTVKNDGNIKEIMTKQVMSTVRFQDSIEYMVEQGVDTFIEIGFKDVLKGFVRKINRDLKVYGANDTETINALKEVIENE